MAKTIVICGHGPGISDAVARKFGAAGYSVALVARNAERLNAAVASLARAGVEARAFPADLGDPKAVRAMIGDVRAALGPITTIHWNPYGGSAKNLLTDPPEELDGVLHVSVHGLVAAVQAALADLKSERGSVLVTGGGLAFYDPKVDGMAVQWGSMGLAIGKAAQHKATGVLHAALAGEGVYVGEVVVLALVKGTAFDHGGATLEASAVADRFWEQNEKRGPATSNIG